MLFPRMVCKIPEVLLRRSLANSRDTSCHRSVIAATRHPGILAAWISPYYRYFKPVLWGKYCGHHARRPYFHCEDKNFPFLSFSKISKQNRLILAFLFHFLSFLDYFIHGLHQYGGQEFSLPTSSFLSFSKISVQNQLILGFLFPFCCFSWLFYEWLVWAAHTAQLVPATRGGIWNVALFYSYHNLCVNSYACVHMNIFSIHFMTL